MSVITWLRVCFSIYYLRYENVTHIHKIVTLVSSGHPRVTNERLFGYLMKQSYTQTKGSGLSVNRLWKKNMQIEPGCMQLAMCTYVIFFSTIFILKFIQKLIENDQLLSSKVIYILNICIFFLSYHNLQMRIFRFVIYHLTKHKRLQRITWTDKSIRKGWFYCVIENAKG